ncbi:MAG: GNAT family N-acetyltransferase [Proteobacteria bacterium]|nr:GNAT family N-acetyltransferase [Pseudomonadota bacterium]
MTIQIRVAVPGDEKALSELNSFVQEFHVTHNPLYFKPVDIQEIKTWFRDLLKKPTVKIWIAEEGGTPVGYASVFIHKRPENPFCRTRKWLEIDQIGVLPEYQRGGIGRCLVQHVLQKACNENISNIELTSWCFNNSAHKAFQKLGFSPKVVRFGLEPSDVDEKYST